MIFQYFVNRRKKKRIWEDFSCDANANRNIWSERRKLAESILYLVKLNWMYTSKFVAELNWIFRWYIEEIGFEFSTSKIMGIYLSEWKISTKKKKERLNFHPIPRQIKAILIIDILQNFKRMISMKLNFSKHSRSASDEGRNLFERKVNSKKRRDDWSKKRERENKETKEKSIPF